jgi:hypothetical protein
MCVCVCVHVRVRVRVHVTLATMYVGGRLLLEDSAMAREHLWRIFSLLRRVDGASSGTKTGIFRV